MRSSHAAAVWMLELLGLDVALAGDLLEERARGRSTIWYWRQVLIAIWMGTWRAVFDHKVLALRAVVTGCAINSVWIFLWGRFLHIGIGQPPLRVSLESIASLLIILLTQVATGWVVAQTHRAQAIPMVFVFMTWLALSSLTGDSEIQRLLVNSIDQPRFHPYLAWYLAPILTGLVGILVGGIVGARPKEPAPRPRHPEPA